jgi:hypothetical protein
MEQQDGEEGAGPHAPKVEGRPISLDLERAEDPKRKSPWHRASRP